MRTRIRWIKAETKNIVLWYWFIAAKCLGTFPIIKKCLFDVLPLSQPLFTNPKKTLFINQVHSQCMHPSSLFYTHTHTHTQILFLRRIIEKQELSTESIRSGEGRKLAPENVFRKPRRGDEIWLFFHSLRNASGDSWGSLRLPFCEARKFSSIKICS